MKFTHAILISLLIWGCRGTLLPEKYEPRSLTWTVDTLLYEKSSQTNLVKIWASSGSNAYAVGHDSRGLSGEIWHYDGSTWYATNLHLGHGGYIEGYFSIRDVFGFSANNVYVVGMRKSPHYPHDDPEHCVILHFDGTLWNYAPIEDRLGVLLCVGGTSPNNVWAAGRSNNIYHYNGNSWTTDSIDHDGYSDANFYLAGKRMAGYEGMDIFLNTYTVYKETGHKSNRLFRRENNKWTLKNKTNSLEGLWMSPSGTLYITSWIGCFIWNENLWTSISDEIQMFGIHGTSDNDIFVTAKMDGGRVYHYNGSDWYEYKELYSTEAGYWDVWTVDGHVFVVGYISGNFPQKSIVWHGQ